MHDFAVVGVGPAGARFARRAAEEGYDVVAFEQGEIGEPLACSGHVSRDLWDYTDGAREDLLQNEIYGARFHTGKPDGASGTESGQPNGTSPRADTGRTDAGHRFYKDEPVSNVIDRVGLDRHLAALARDAGADVREGHTVTDVEEDADSVALTVRGPDGTETVRARMVAGCDGPRSRVRSALGLPEPEELLHGVLGFDETADGADHVDVHLTPPRFFAWRIPRGEAGVEYGLATPPGDDVGDRFAAFVEGYGADVGRRCSGAIPIGPPDTVTAHRGFLIGDAAAQTKPFTGGGILYGMRCADHAVDEIEPDRPGTLGAYEAAWRDDLGSEILLGKGLRRAYSLPEPVQRAGLWALSGEIGVHMDRPTSVFSREHLKTFLTPSATRD